jgi:hypothetical protein
MAGLNAYLAEVHTPVETLTLASPQGREAAFGSADNQAPDVNQGMSQNLGQNAGQGSQQQEPQQGPQPGYQSLKPSIAGTVPNEPAAIEAPPAPATYAFGQAGAHISVVA